MKSSRYSNSSRWLRTCLLLLVSSFSLHSSSFANEAPLYIPFQGQVTNQQGNIVADGQYSVIFNLYDQPVGGQPVWSERHTKIGVTRGMINVFLGSIAPLISVDFSQIKYLGITVDTDNLATTADPEMVPRSLILPSFHAKNAEKLAGHNWTAVMTGNDPSTSFIKSNRIDADTINTNQMVNSAVTETKLAANSVTNTKIADGSVTNSKLAANSVSTANIQDGAVTSAKLSSDVTTPPGTIVAYIGDTAPTGWHLCHGADLPRGGVNANLEAVVGTRFGTAANPATHFKLPDLRGYFLRGIDGGTGRDPDSSGSINGGADGKRFPMSVGGSLTGIGSVQRDALQRITGSVGAIGDVGFVADGAFYNLRTGGTLSNDGQPDRTVGFDSGRVTRASTETRPLNAYVNYIIKY